MSEQSKVGMEVLAEAAFYIQDMNRGVVGEFNVEEDGWGEGGAPAAVAEVRRCLAVLRDGGWKDCKSLLRRAPYTHNVSVGVFQKKFPAGKRWVVLTMTTRFSISAKFESFDKEPF